MTPKQKAIYDAIVEFKKEHDGCTPSYAHIAEMTGITKSTIHYNVGKLEDAGHIRRPFGSAQHIEIVGAHWIAPADRVWSTVTKY